MRAARISPEGKAAVYIKRQPFLPKWLKCRLPSSMPRQLADGDPLPNYRPLGRSRHIRATGEIFFVTCDSGSRAVDVQFLRPDFRREADAICTGATTAAPPLRVRGAEEEEEALAASANGVNQIYNLSEPNWVFGLPRQTPDYHAHLSRQFQLRCTMGQLV